MRVRIPPPPPFPRRSSPPRLLWSQRQKVEILFIYSHQSTVKVAVYVPIKNTQSLRQLSTPPTPPRPAPSKQACTSVKTARRPIRMRPPLRILFLHRNPPPSAQDSQERHSNESRLYRIPECPENPRPHREIRLVKHSNRGRPVGMYRRSRNRSHAATRDDSHPFGRRNSRTGIQSQTYSRPYARPNRYSHPDGGTSGYTYTHPDQHANIHQGFHA